MCEIIRTVCRVVVVIAIVFSISLSPEKGKRQSEKSVLALVLALMFLLVSSESRIQNIYVIFYDIILYGFRLASEFLVINASSIDVFLD